MARARVNGALIYLANARLKAMADNKGRDGRPRASQEVGAGRKDTVTDLAARVDEGSASSMVK